MYTTDSELETWRQKMLQKYGGLARPNGRVLPVGGSFDEGGIRYTGAGPNDFIERSEPAGIVHEGEMVIEAPAVKKAGGPRAVREEIEGMRSAEKRGMPGYQTGSLKVPDLSSIAKAGGDLASSGTISGVGTFSPTTEPWKPPKAITGPSGMVTPTSGISGLDSVIGGLSSAKSGFEKTIKNIITPKEGVSTPTAITGPSGMVKPTEGYEPPKAIEGPGGMVSTTTEGYKPPTMVEGPGKEPGPGLDKEYFEGITREGIEGMRSVARGESEAARLERERAQAALAGEQAAERIARRQELAQAGEGEETAAAAMARLGREERLAKTALEGELATKAAERAEQAMGEIARLGTEALATKEGQQLQRDALAETIRANKRGEELTDAQREQALYMWKNMSPEEKARLDLDTRIGLASISNMEEMRKIDWANVDISRESEQFAREKWYDQFGLDLQRFGLDERQVNALIAQNEGELALGWAKFQENARQFGVEYALRKQESDWGIQGPIAQALIEAGDAAGANDILKNFGMSVDLGAIADEASRRQVSEAAANLTSLVTENVGQSTADLLKNPEINTELDRMWNNLPDSQKEGLNQQQWKQNRLDAIQLATDPVRGFIAEMGGEEDLARALGWDSADAFSFLDVSGPEAVQLAMTNMYVTGGMKMTEDGLQIDPNSAGYQFMIGPNLGGEGEGPEPTRTDEQRIEDLEALRDSVNKGETPTVEDITSNVQTMSVQNIPVGGGAAQWLDTHSESNPGGWINVDGTALKIQEGYDNGSLADTVFLIDPEGNKYTLDENGNWYSGWHQYTETTKSKSRVLGTTEATTHPDVAGLNIESPIGG